MRASVSLALFSILAYFYTGVPNLGAAPRAKATAKPKPASTKATTKKKVIRPSEIRLPPLPKPTPKPPRVRGIQTQTKSAEAIHLAPNIPIEKPKSGSFVLSKASQPGKLLLTFEHGSEKVDFDSNAPLAIQLNPEGKLTLEPTFIDRTLWPKNSRQMVISYRGANPKQENLILGKASYLVCSADKKCHREKTPIVFQFK